MMQHKQLFSSINAFIAVANSGSFSKAAKLLESSQPSISRLVSELEGNLGVRLLQRSTRKLSLTEAGIIYLNKVQKIQLDLIEAKQALNAFKEIASGTLRIGAPLHWVDLFISPFLTEFLQAFPEIKVEIIATDEHQDIIKDNVDVVLRVGDPKHVTYVAIPLKPVRLLLCASDTYLKQHGAPTSITQLAEHNCLTYGQFNHWLTQKDGQLHQLKVNGNLNSNIVTVLIESCIQGLGLILLPDLLVNKHLKSNQLAPIMLENQWTIKHATIENMYAIYSDRKHLPAKTRAFLDFFKEKIQLI